MKQISLFLTTLLFLVLSYTTQAQQVSRTGQQVEKTVVTYEELEKLPLELRKIIKSNPQKFVLVDKHPSKTFVTAAEFNNLPVDKQNYILSHPEKYTVEGKPRNTNTISATQHSSN